MRSLGMMAALLYSGIGWDPTKISSTGMGGGKYIRTSDYVATKKIAGRNDPCPCGSGKKYKKCCLVESISLEEIYRRKKDAEAKRLSDSEKEARDRENNRVVEDNGPSGDRLSGNVPGTDDKEQQEQGKNK